MTAQRSVAAEKLGCPAQSPGARIRRFEPAHARKRALSRPPNPGATEKPRFNRRRSVVALPPQNRPQANTPGHLEIEQSFVEPARPSSRPTRLPTHTVNLATLLGAHGRLRGKEDGEVLSTHTILQCNSDTKVWVHSICREFASSRSLSLTRLCPRACAEASEILGSIDLDQQAD